MPEDMDTKKKETETASAQPPARPDPAQLLNTFLDAHGLTLLISRSEVTHMENGGVVIRPNITVSYRQ